MSADAHGSENAPSQNLDAASVIAEAIEAMREHPQAQFAADAIENAWSSHGFKVERAVKEVKSTKPAEEAED
jgi:hypothetical protein